eukprot:CAMPEP_0194121864 /NCGR_PEP_ID=MMETSP0150-20130528/48711_1 /TAXON_ID=122233 /ORGANISM="Chaetoceros debilis, Strain MM31A-1" /LENGTH=347 /DNA_ID=CAMNT_0038814499 /DNA_START=140 /DNA_END=1180 /DNA_ORIENTATION=+
MKILASSLAIAATVASFPFAAAFGISSGRGLKVTPTSTSKTTTSLFDVSLESRDGHPPIIIPTDADSVEPTIPAVVTGKEADGLIGNVLPLGIRLTGGEKLREDGLTGKGVKVAVIDSGVANWHPNFDRKVVEQVWFRRGGSLSSTPGADHGTHVAGTIHMMAPEAEIYDYRVFGSQGKVGVNRAIAMAIDEAVDMGCDVINMSIQYGAADFSWNQAMRRAKKEGVLIVAAAGNSGDGSITTNENSWPANFESAISVGAISKQDNLPTASFSNTNDQVDYAGVGVNVISYSPKGSFVGKNGTSMASPHVCGFIAALMTKGGMYEDSITGDASLRALLNDKFCIDIGR